MLHHPQPQKENEVFFCHLVKWDDIRRLKGGQVRCTIDLLQVATHECHLLYFCCVRNNKFPYVCLMIHTAMQMQYSNAKLTSAFTGKPMQKEKGRNHVNKVKNLNITTKISLRRCTHYSASIYFCFFLIPATKFSGLTTLIYPRQSWGFFLLTQEMEKRF